jgi:hypothetical protein
MQTTCCGWSPTQPRSIPQGKYKREFRSLTSVMHFADCIARKTEKGFANSNDVLEFTWLTVFQALPCN